MSRVVLIVFAALVSCGLIAPAMAMPDLATPWPNPDAVGDIDGTRVTFPSHSPFTFSDVGDGPEDDAPTEAVGVLFMPESASAASPVPAVVLLHGAAGVLSSREVTYGKQFAAMGVAALVVDVFGARRDRATRFIDRLIEITEAMMLADAYAGLRFLGARPDIDTGRIALIGFSYGGMATTYAAYAQVAERYAPDGERFAGHAAYYAPCIARFDDNRATGAPLLMQFGGKDAIVDRERCALVAEELRTGGAEVEVVIYEDAHHQWDGRFTGPRMIGRNLADCDLVVESDGTVRDRTFLVPMNGTLMRKLILAMCADDEGYLIGRDDEVRTKSNAALGRFLERVLAAPRKDG